MAFPVDFWLLQFVFYRFHGLIQLIVGFRIILIRLILNLYIGGDSFPLMLLPLGVKYFAMVNFTQVSSFRSKICCTTPFPYVWVPTISPIP